MAICLDFDWQTNEFMLYCRTTQLREKTMLSYEQTLRLFERWCKEEQGISTVDICNFSLDICVGVLIILLFIIIIAHSK